MSTTVVYDVIILGGGKGDKTLAIELEHKGLKTVLIDRRGDDLWGLYQRSVNSDHRPVVSGASMSLSSVSIIGNSLRLQKAKL
jgi:hypothetical protein